MSRYTRPAAFRLLFVPAFAFAVVAASPRALAQGLDGKELARAKFALSRADPRDLVRAKREAAEGEFKARTEEFNAGRGTLDILRESWRHLLEAELAVSATDADHVAALERNWEHALAFEEVNRQRWEAGRLPFKEYQETRYDRLEAEIQLGRALVRMGKGAALVGGVQVQMAPLHSKELARAKFAATQSNPSELAREKVEAAHWAYASRYREFAAGRGTLDILLEASRRVAEATLAVRDGPADRVAILERLWERTWVNELINVARHQAGRIPFQDVAQTRHARLDAQMQWLQARARQEAPLIGGQGIPQPGVWDDDIPHAVDVKDLARAKFAAAQADLRDLARARVETIRTEFAARKIEFLNGRGTLDILLEASENLLAAEAAVSGNPEDRLAALERRWERACIIEAINKERHEAGRVPIQNYLQTKHARLAAELALLSARKRP